jgi:hypothetical protein
MSVIALLFERTSIPGSRPWRWLPLLALCAFLPLAAQATPLQDPEPIMVPPGMSEASIVKAIRLGAAKRGWLITKADPGHMEATINVRVHTAKVNIDYDTAKVAITYLGSENLEYAEKNGQRHIHGNYNKWVRNLSVDIASELALLPPDAK